MLQIIELVSISFDKCYLFVVWTRRISACRKRGQWERWILTSASVFWVHYTWKHACHNFYFCSGVSFRCKNIKNILAHKLTVVRNHRKSYYLESIQSFYCFSCFSFLLAKRQIDINRKESFRVCELVCEFLSVSFVTDR